MFRRMISTYLLLVMTALGTGTMTRLAESAPVVQTTGTRHLPAGPTVPLQQNAPAAPLSTSQMTVAQGEGVWGWLKKIWKKYKKKIIKVVWEIIKEIIEEWLSETSQQVEGINGEVVEHHQGEDQTEEVYASQSDYENGNMQSSSYVDYGYTYQYTDYSGGSYEY